MCGSMVNIQSPAAEIRRGKKRRRRKEEQTTAWKYISTIKKRIALSLEEDWRTAKGGSIYRKFHEVWTYGFWHMRVGRQTHRHTDMLIVILRTSPKENSFLWGGRDRESCPSPLQWKRETLPHSHPLVVIDYSILLSVHPHFLDRATLHV